MQKQIIDGCGWYAVHWSFENFDIVIIMVYFKCGEGIQGATNALLWSGLLTFVTRLAKPVIVVGDFNATPEEFMTTTMSTVLQMQVLATGEDTCLTGRELDWALVTNALHPETSIKVDWQVPFKPHGQLIVHLARDLRHISVNQIQRFQPAPKLDKVRIEWTHLEEVDLPVKWLQMPTNSLTQRAGIIYHKIERYVLQNHDQPGTQLSFAQKPLADPSRPWIWKRGALAFWAQMEVRLQQHLHRAQGEHAVMHHLEKLGWHIYNNWHSDANMTQEGFSRCCGRRVTMNTLSFCCKQSASNGNCTSSKFLTTKLKNTELG